MPLVILALLLFLSSLAHAGPTNTRDARVGLNTKAISELGVSTCEAMVTAIGATPTILKLDRNITAAACTIPATITLECQGGMIDLNSTANALTIVGPLSGCEGKQFITDFVINSVSFAGTRAKRITQQMWGAAGDNSTDDTAEVQAWLTAADDDVEAYCPKGTYKLTDDLALPSGLTLTGAGQNNCIFDFSSYAGTGPVATITGTIGSQLTLASDATAGSVTVVLNDASSLAAGDQLLLGSDAAFKALAISNVKKGEMVVIASIATNTLTLKSPLYDAYATTDTARVYKVTPAQNVKVRDVAFKRETQTTASRQGITVTYGKNVTFERVYINYATERAIYFNQSIDSSVSESTIENTFYTGTGTSYSVSIANASQNIKIHHNTFLTFRHAISPGKDTDIGIPRNLLFDHNYAEQRVSSTAAVYDCHEQGQFITYDTNYGISGGNASTYGITCSSFDSTMKGNTVYAAGGIRIENDLATGNLIEANQIHLSNGSGNGVFIRSDETRIEKNHIKAEAGTSTPIGIAAIKATSGSQIAGVAILGNTVLPKSTGIRVDGCLRCQINNNTIKNPGAAHGISIQANGAAKSDYVQVFTNIIADTQGSPTMSRGLLSTGGPHTNLSYGGNTIIGATVADVEIAAAETLQTKSSRILPSPPAAQTIAAGDTITADACGTVKSITAAGAVTTSTTNTFTAPAATNGGCQMQVCNTGSQNITLDNNANFKSAGAADVVMTGNDCVSVVSTGASGAWYQVSALLAN